MNVAPIRLRADGGCDDEERHLEPQCDRRDKFAAESKHDSPLCVWFRGRACSTRTSGSGVPARAAPEDDHTRVRDTEVVEPLTRRRNSAVDGAPIVDPD